MHLLDNNAYLTTGMKYVFIKLKSHVRLLTRIYSMSFATFDVGTIMISCALKISDIINAISRLYNHAFNLMYIHV